MTGQRSNAADSEITAVVGFGGYLTIGGDALTTRLKNRIQAE